MRKNSVAIEDAPAAPIRPEMLGKLKKEDMKAAIVERFKVTTDAATTPNLAERHARSPYWQAADEEC